MTLPITSMESHIASAVGLLLCLYCLLRWYKSNSTKKHPPQPSGSWPVIGHLHILGVHPHISLGKLADKYGPIFMIKLGVNRAVVVSSHTVAKECLGKNDRVFLDRPQTIFVEHLAYNSAMFGLGLHGQYWREMRKITTVELLSNHRVEMLKHIRILELRLAIKDIYVKRNNQPVDMKRWFNDLSLNSTVRLIAGRSLKKMYHGDKYDKTSKALRDFFELAGVFVPADAIPFLRWFDFGGHEKNMKKVAEELDQVAQEWLIYLDAVLKETLRMYPAAPIPVPRVAVEDCTVSSYHIPAGTQLFLNLYKIHRDPEVWPNPLEFQPERFLTAQKDYNLEGRKFAFIPFGSGRRICSGITLAMKSMMLTLATLLHGFDMSIPSEETIDMTEGFRLSNLKAIPLDVILIPRLLDNLYDAPTNSLETIRLNASTAQIEIPKPNLCLPNSYPTPLRTHHHSPPLDQHSEYFADHHNHVSTGDGTCTGDQSITTKTNTLTSLKLRPRQPPYTAS